MTDGPIRPLTDAEQRVAKLIGRGFDIPEVARRLESAPSTVRSHVNTIALKIPNPDGLGPYRLVMLWASHQQWAEDRDLPRSA